MAASSSSAAKTLMGWALGTLHHACTHFHLCMDILLEVRVVYQGRPLHDLPGGAVGTMFETESFPS